MYNLLIADDHPLFREAIANVLAEKFGGGQTMEAGDLEAALELALAQEDLDLILLDLNMPGMDGLNGLIKLRNSAPSIPVVIISAEQERKTILTAITYGAAGFIIKSLPRKEMCHALEQVLAGNIYLPPEAVRLDTTATVHPRSDHRPAISRELLSSLTRRQIKVLQHMTLGESNKKIAYNLNISETTVKAHVSAILKKLDVTNRIQAVLSASEIDFKHM